MSLKEIPLKYEYRSDGADLVKDFYTPCLRNATQYWRAVGYFTSNSLEYNTKGLKTFIQQGGQMRLVTSPRLMEDDIEAMQHGYDAKEQNPTLSFNHSFEEVKHDRLALLTWLIAHGYLDIKIAYPFNTNTSIPHAMYHEKIGVFLDDMNNTVAFAGSQNETVGGLLNNFEFIDVHWSWDDTQQRVQQKIDNFKRLWNNATDKLRVVDFPTAVVEDILVHQTVYEIVPDSLPPNPSEIVEATAAYLPNNLVLRNYQTEAIDAWFENGCRGLWEMATGTGKTITALSALARLREEKKRLFVLIVCPYQHLVDQWYKTVVHFKFKPILAYKNSSAWIKPLSTAMVQHNWGNRSVVCAITTRKTFIGITMQKMLSRVQHDAVLIADEVHHLGATASHQKLTDVFNLRLGLSATPDRWFDDKGTETLKAYFGKIVYEFSLNKAIAEGYLCPYDYHPHLVELTDEELVSYERLTEQISRQYHRIKSDEPNESLKRLLIERAQLLNKAENKLPTLTKILTGKTDSLHHTLFYCAPGQLRSVIRILTNLGLRVAKFTAKESTSERQKLLERFASGHLQALVAMRCLDEGVDVPSTQTAYILASSSNPKEFIQRRGRILRKAVGKERAEIHDLIAVPPLVYQEYPSATFATERKIVEKELRRFNEFAGAALNKNRALVKIQEFAKIYNMLGLLGES